MFYQALSKASVKLAFSILIITNSQLLFAVPKVVDSVSLAQQAQQKSERQATENQAKANSQLFYQLQILQDEMMKMRGQMEEQAHQISQLKQQRLDDYIAFDKRIAALATQPIKVPSVSAISPDTTALPSNTSGNEQNDYKSAFTLVREKKAKEAKIAFSAFIKNYPKSSLLPNCYFWLGRLQAQTNQLDEANASFGEIIKRFPEDKRVPETILHRAKVQFELGDKIMPKTELENLIARHSHSTDTSLQRTVRQAREFIQTHYP